MNRLKLSGLHPVIREQWLLFHIPQISSWERQMRQSLCKRYWNTFELIRLVHGLLPVQLLQIIRYVIYSSSSFSLLIISLLINLDLKLKLEIKTNLHSECLNHYIHIYIHMYLNMYLSFKHFYWIKQTKNVCEAFCQVFFFLYHLKLWTIMALSNICVFSIFSNPCSAIHLHQLITVSLHSSWF